MNSCFQCLLFVFFFCMALPGQPCRGLESGDVEPSYDDTWAKGYMVFQQRPEEAVVTTGKGHLSFRPQWKGAIASPQYSHIRKSIIDAMKIWSEFILENLELRVNVEFKVMDRRVNAGAAPSFAKIKIAEFVPILQRKLANMGFGKLVFPSGEALTSALSLHRPAGLKETTWMDIPASIAKNLLPKETYNSLYGKFEAEIHIEINDRYRTEAVQPRVTAMIGNGKTESIMQIALHEIGHGLGFLTALGNNYSKYKFWCPMPLDLFRFQGGTSIDFTKTPRFYDQKSQFPHVWFDPYPLEGRVAFPQFESGGGDFEASHWKDNSYPHPFGGIMDPNRDVGVQGDFTPADKRAFSRLGYKMNDLPKPIIYEIWRKKTISGTYFGVSGHLLIAPTVEYMFISDKGIRHLIESRTTQYLLLKDTTKDIVKFLDRRENFLQAFAVDPGTALPDLRSSKKWRLQARNKFGQRCTAKFLPEIESHQNLTPISPHSAYGVMRFLLMAHGMLYPCWINGRMRSGATGRIGRPDPAPRSEFILRLTSMGGL